MCVFGGILGGPIPREQWNSGLTLTLGMLPIRGRPARSLAQRLRGFALMMRKAR